MLDTAVQQLLEDTINSPLKLQLLLMFTDNSATKGPATRIAERAYRDIWSTREALTELARDGVLSEAQMMGGESTYCFNEQYEQREVITRLAKLYNEPLERDHIQRLVRETAPRVSSRFDAATTFEVWF